MAFAFQVDEPWREGIRRLILEQVDLALDSLAARQPPDGVAVHEARKSCKRIRALLRLVSRSDPEFCGRENAFFREAAAGLSAARDADTVLAAWDALMAHEANAPVADRVTGIREFLGERKRKLQGKPSHKKLAARFSRELKEARQRLERWPIPGDARETVRKGVLRAYRRARRGMSRAAAEPTADQFHEWRKRTKDFFYQCSLLRNVWDFASKRRRDRLDELGERLGNLHDLAVLSQALRDQNVDHVPQENVDFAEHLISARCRQLEHAALKLGERVFRRRPRTIRKKTGSIP